MTSTTIPYTNHYRRKRCRSTFSSTGSVHLDHHHPTTTTTMETPSSRLVTTWSVSTTLFTLLLISGSVHSFQPALASPSSYSRWNTDHITTTTTTTNELHDQRYRKRYSNTHLSASTAVPPSSFHQTHESSKTNSLFFREYDSEKCRTHGTTTTLVARIPSKVDSTNITQPSKIQQPITRTNHKVKQPVGTTTTAISDARKAWERKYCSVAGLRESFGTNRNVIWGDFDASMTRRLYKCLLPVALLELYETGHVSPQDLAPLAYRARVAAKLYARERSHIPARLAAAAFDGYRQWRKYGRFDSNGMSYDQVWNKYAAMIIAQEKTASSQISDTTSTTPKSSTSTNTATATLSDVDEDDSVAAKICLKILERSCHSNEMIDRLVLKHHQRGSGSGKFKNDVMSRRQRRQDLQELRQVAEQLERDVQLLLQQPDQFIDRDEEEEDRTGGRSLITPVSLSEQKQQAQKFRALRAVARVKRRIATLQAQTLASLSHHHHHHHI